MKRLFYTVALVVMGFTASYAQKAKHVKLTAEQRAEKESSLMQEKLGLTADQKSKIQIIQLERIKKTDEWRADTASRRDKSKMAERRAYAKANQEKVDAILTPEQKTKWNAEKAEMKEKMKNRRPHREKA